MYFVVMSNCVACGAVFHFNPHSVPSIVVGGVREPVCRNCAERWNQLHPDAARPILPGAYEPIADEGEDLADWDRLGLL
jgi:hypothetical protein